uniref:Uncharacterized protein n=1 Tax=Wolfiporia cocos TaxID=81056 RepID=A0A7G7YDW1_9APHY|nr:hypothetical protein [Wolfiporia cocos]
MFVSVGIFSGLFHLTSVSQWVDTFLFIIGSFVLISWLLIILKGPLSFLISNSISIWANAKLAFKSLGLTLRLPATWTAPDSVLHQRISYVILTYSGPLSINIKGLYIQFIGYGVGICCGVIQLTSVSQWVYTILMLVGSIIFQSLVVHNLMAFFMSLSCSIIILIFLKILLLYVILSYTFLDYIFSSIRKTSSFCRSGSDLSKISARLSDEMLRSQIQNVNMGVMGTLLVVLNQASGMDALSFLDNIRFVILLYIIIYMLISSNLFFEIVKFVKIFPQFLAEEVPLTNKESTPAMDKTAGGSSLNVNKFTL